MPLKDPSGRPGSQVAVVTGAGSGLGRALALELSSRNVCVVGFGRRSGALGETAALARPGMFIPKAIDIGNDDAVAEAFADIRNEVGEVAILINNAAVHPRRDFLQETHTSFMATVAANLGGVVSCTKAALSSMTQSGRGRILNVGSFADLAPQPGSAAYSVSKGAMRILTQALVADLSDRFPGIVISTWMPGILVTKMERPDCLDPAIAARWGADLALCDDPTLNGAVFERDHELVVQRSLKRRIRDRLLFRKVPVPRTVDLAL